MTDSIITNDDQIEPSLDTIGGLFAPQIDKVFTIPQYQRDYSWNLNEKQPQQFFKDIIDRLDKDDKEEEFFPIHHSYFIGTMLFKGNWKRNSGHLEVIDGQQRLTTTYLFLGALSNRFCTTAEELRLATPDDSTPDWLDLASTFAADGNRIKKNRLQTPQKPYKKGTEVRLEIETGANVMETLIFGEQSDKDNLLPECQAENNLIQSYTYMYNQLSIESLATVPKFARYLRPISNPNNQSISSEDLYRIYSNYLRILCGIEEQIDTPSVAILSMQSDKEINEVFESLNSKGKGLEQVDLIKNNLFERLTPKPLNKAHKYWGEIKKGLSMKQTPQMSEQPWINLEQFFLLYSIAIEGVKGSQNKLYRSFLKLYGLADERELVKFLRRTNDFVPDVAALFGNVPLQNEKVDAVYLDHVKEGLRYLVRTQTARQSYPLLAGALYASRKGALKSAVLVELIDYLAVAFLFLKDVRGSKYTKILQDTAHCLANTVREGYLNEDLRPAMASWYIRNLEDQLSDVIGEVTRQTVQEMLNKDEDFEYSNHTGDIKARARVRYLLRIHCYRLLLAEKDKGPGTEAAFTWNVEHILPDSKEDHSITHQLGNLLWLDKATNDECKDKSVSDKLHLYQQKAANPEIAEMTDFFTALNGDSKAQEAAIKQRSEDILYELYLGVVKKPTTRKHSLSTSQNRADSCYSNSLIKFIEAKGRKYQYDIQKNQWFLTFSSAFLCVSLKQNGEESVIQYPDNGLFDLPFITLKGKSGIEKINNLTEYVEIQLKKHNIFRRVGERSRTEDNLGPYILNLLTTYKDYLAN